MHTVLIQRQWKSCLVYFSDVMIYFESIDGHRHCLRNILEAIRSADLAIKPKKCHLGHEEVNYFGHVISGAGVGPNREKSAAIGAFHAPIDKKSVRRYLGLSACYRRSIENFSEIAEPLFHLMRNDTHFIWAG